MQASKKWNVTNVFFTAAIIAGSIVWLLQLHTFGITIAAAGLAISYFLFKRNRWAYFAAAIWCFGLLRIAMDDDLGFYGDYGSYVKLPYVIGIVIAIILHEKVAIKDKKDQPEDIPE
jgi:4-hydroxybenzoate polyprenyltransferase